MLAFDKAEFSRGSFSLDSNQASSSDARAKTVPLLFPGARRTGNPRSRSQRFAVRTLHPK
jgi:hypothetical protein